MSTKHQSAGLATKRTVRWSQPRGRAQQSMVGPLCLLILLLPSILPNASASPCLDNFAINPVNSNASKLSCCDPLVPKTIPDDLDLVLPDLEIVDLRNCSLIGTIPRTLGALALLKELYLGGNFLTGGIPPLDDGGFVSLCAFRVDNNGLNGTVPSNIGYLALLEDLSLADNDLWGSLPTQLGRLTLLKRFHLLGNRGIVSTIPLEFGALSHLKNLQLQDMSLSGTIPSQLAQLTALATLDFGANVLEGTVPALLSALTNLTKFNMNDNLLVGSLPASFSGLTMLTQFRVSGNRFHGPLPDFSAIPGVTLDPSDFRYLNTGESCAESPTMCSLGPDLCADDTQTCVLQPTVSPSSSPTSIPSRQPTYLAPSQSPTTPNDNSDPDGNTNLTQPTQQSPLFGVLVALMPAVFLSVVLWWRHDVAEGRLERELEVMVKVNILLESALREAKNAEHLQQQSTTDIPPPSPIIDTHEGSYLTELI